LNMGTSQLEQFAYTMLQPAQNPQDARTEFVQFGANLAIPAGCAVGQKTSDNKCYPLLSTAGSNEVQTVAVNNIMTGGSIQISAYDYLGVKHDVYVAYSTSWTVTVAAIATALNAAGVLGASAVACAVTNTHDMTITWSGTNYAGITQPLVGIGIENATGPTTVAVSRTTVGGTTDGTQLAKGFNQYAIQTDASGNVYMMTNGTAGPSYRQTPRGGAPIFVTGTFNPQDLITRGTTVAEVDTFTPTNPTTGDVNTITITYPNLTTYSVSFTVGATQTATAWTTLAVAAWNADPIASLYAAATGTTTLVLTSVNPGNIMALSAAVVGTGTVAKVVTTGALGRNIADVISGIPGIRVLANGNWQF
jgi:hypothetical protein